MNTKLDFEQMLSGFENAKSSYELACHVDIWQTAIVEGIYDLTENEEAILQTSYFTALSGFSDHRVCILMTNPVPTIH